MMKYDNSPFQVKILIDVSLALTDVDLYKHSNGSKLFPSRTCKDLKQSQPALKSGEVEKFVGNHGVQ